MVRKLVLGTIEVMNVNLARIKLRLIIMIMMKRKLL